MRRVNSIVMSADEFRAMLHELYGDDVYTDFSADGLYVGKTEDDLPIEDLHEKLAVKLNVQEITSIHIDDMEPTGVWIAYAEGIALRNNPCILGQRLRPWACA